MNTHYSHAVESEHTAKSPRDLLASPVTVLVGVDEDAKAALSAIDVETVHDLATSPVFEVARAVTATAASGDPSGNADRTTAVSAANRLADGDPSDLAAAAIERLEGVSQSAATTLTAQLGVATVRDLARWPPYGGARSILGALTGQESETHEGVPEELVPVARKYGTEQTFYTKVYLDKRVAELSEEGDEEVELLPEDVLEDIRDHGVTVDWSPQWNRVVETLGSVETGEGGGSGESEAGETGGEGESAGATAAETALSTTAAHLRTRNLLATVEDRRIDVTTADPNVGGFRQPAVGGIIQFSQTWVPQGLSLGQLLHSTTLAPGESTKVAVIDWSRRTEGQRQEAESQREETEASMVQNRSIREVQDGVTSEVQHGSSMVSSTSTSEQAGATRNRGLFGLGGSSSRGGSRSTTETNTVSTSRGRREVHAEMTQKIRNSTQQHASSARTRRATVVRETEQDESEEVRTRIVTNHNHMHALSVHYYEVVQIFRVEVGPENAKPVLFVPFEPLDFSDTEVIFQYRQALKDAALDETTRSMIDDATGYVEVHPDFELGAGETYPTIDAQLRTLGAERTGDYAVSMPDDNALVGLSLSGPPATFRVHRSDGSTDTLRSGDGTFYELDRPVPFEDVDTISADVTGEWATSDEELDRTLVIETDHPNLPANAFMNDEISFSVEVSGDIEQASRSLAGFVLRGRDSTSVSDHGASGRLIGGRVGFRFSGAIESVSVTGSTDAEVYVDGQVWDGESEAATGAGDRETLDVGLSVERPDGTRGTVFGTIDLFQDTGEFRIADVRGADTLDELTRRLEEESLHYSQAVWQSLDRQTLAMLLGEFQIDGRSAAEFVDPTPEAVHGNYVAFPLSIPETPAEATDETYAKLATWWDGWREANFDATDRDRDLVPLPSGGVHGESILGRANGAEKLDITRFWDWQESPIPQQAPQIAPVDTGSRASDEDLTPSDFEAPIVNLQQPQQLPDPTGVGGVLDVLGNSNMFRDMSGMEAAAEVAETTSQLSGQGARHATDAAVETFKTGAQAQNQALSTVADTITSLAGGGAFSAANAGNSSFGASLNELKKMGGRGDGEQAVEQRTGTSDGGNGSSSGGSGGSNGGGNGSSSGGGGGSGGGSGGDGTGGGSPRSDGGMDAREAIAKRMDPTGGRQAVAAGPGSQMLPGGGSTSPRKGRLISARWNLVSAAIKEENDWTSGGSKVQEGSMESTLKSYYQSIVDNASFFDETWAKNWNDFDGDGDAESIWKNAANNETAWSAAFISYCADQAGLEPSDGFAFSFRHITYITYALKQRLNENAQKPVWLYGADEVEPRVGDILCKRRTTNEQWTLERLKSHYLQNTGSQSEPSWELTVQDDLDITGKTHCDIVVDTQRQNGTLFIETLGGNTYDEAEGIYHTVGRKRWKETSDGWKMVDASGNVSTGWDSMAEDRVFGFIRIAHEALGGGN